MAERKTYEIETEAGKFYIQVFAANRRTYAPWNGGASHTVEDINGRVRLSTDPQFEGKVSLGHIKIRGRKYTIEHFLTWSPESQGWANESQWRGPYCNDKDQQISHNAKAWDTLYDLEREALAKFAQEYPEWERESTRLLFESERDSYQRKAAAARKEAAEHDAAAAKWQARIDQLAAAA